MSIFELILIRLTAKKILKRMNKILPPIDRGYECLNDEYLKTIGLKLIVSKYNQNIWYVRSLPILRESTLSTGTRCYGQYNGAIVISSPSRLIDELTDKLFLKPFKRWLD